MPSGKKGVGVGDRRPGVGEEKRATTEYPAGLLKDWFFVTACERAVVLHGARSSARFVRKLRAHSDWRRCFVVRDSQSKAMLVQTSEVYRQGIVLPLDASAEARLRRSDLDESVLVDYLEIGADLFEPLWHLGLFSEINERCGALISEYEEDLVEAHQLSSLISAIESAKSKTYSTDPPEIREFLTSLDDLARKAQSSNRPLLFVL